ncbi:16S rRNA (cytosine(1407)-C(5))-methyltransferase RsmF [Celerinatantimonas yamalensis]|uniref:Ribosomal RNA small subunit methyltransferase F n=1 Tax=Celerinatantimonas yamalensis TaxID=559956 RepID=A0ABW9G387_9GAMM
MSASLPQDFIQLIGETVVDERCFEQFLHYCDQPLRRSVRVNTLKITVTEFVTRMTNQGWMLTPIPWCEQGFWLEREDETTPLGNTLEHLGGLFYIQEASSMLPVSALFHFIRVCDAPLLLDAAAAPGSKTTQIAARLAHQGAIVANEFSASRIKGLYSNLQRCGIANVALTNYNADVFGRWLPETFNGILLDAPCSGEGTLRKDPHAMSNWSIDHVNEIAALQLQLLDSALHALKTGGVVIYSTCTLNHLENQHVIANLQARFPDAVEVLPLAKLFNGAHQALTPEGYLHVWPQTYDCEGFFVAALRKVKTLEAPSVIKKVRALPFSLATNKQAQVLAEHIRVQFGLKLPQNSRLMTRDNEFWLFPEQLYALTNDIRFDRIGIKVAEQFKKEIKLTHEAISYWANQITNNIIECDSEQAQAFMQGRDLPWPDAKAGDGEVVIRYQQTTLGLGKWLKGKIKNRLPRELVRDTVQFS